MVPVTFSIPVPLDSVTVNPDAAVCVVVTDEDGVPVINPKCDVGINASPEHREGSSVGVHFENFGWRQFESSTGKVCDVPREEGKPGSFWSAMATGHYGERKSK
jgi:hypothetical protein